MTKYIIHYLFCLCIFGVSCIGIPLKYSNDQKCKELYTFIKEKWHYDSIALEYPLNGKKERGYFQKACNECLKGVKRKKIQKLLGQPNRTNGVSDKYDIISCKLMPNGYCEYLEFKYDDNDKLLGIIAGGGVEWE